MLVLTLLRSAASEPKQMNQYKTKQNNHSTVVCVTKDNGKPNSLKNETQWMDTCQNIQLVQGNFNQDSFHDHRALLESLKACTKQRNLRRGSSIHSEILKSGSLLENNTFIANALISLYGKCGALEEARYLFDALPVRNVVSCNVMITGYADHGYGYDALCILDSMIDYGFLPNIVTFICILKACASTGLLKKGEEIHDHIVKKGLFGKNVILGTALVDMYAKCGKLEEAQSVFDVLPERNNVSWNTLISGYIQQGCGYEALNCFEKMENEGLSPDAFTYACVLKACATVGSLEKGEEIHSEIQKQQVLRENVVLNNALLDMYVKCGALTKARNVFSALVVRNDVTWTTLINGYAQHGYGSEAVRCFELMQQEGFPPNAFAFACVLKACGSIRCIKKGKEMHEVLAKQGLLENNVIIGTALVDMYAKCGAFEKAQSVFHELPERNVVSWSALIAGYAQYGLGEEALFYFDKMQNQGLSPNAFTYAVALKACGIVGAYERGAAMHVEIQKQGLLENNVLLCNALVDMYAKCGDLVKAQDVLNQLPGCAVSWNAVIAGYSQIGEIGLALNSYNQMISEDIVPDVVTYVALLVACSHACLVEQALVIFNTMETVYHLTPILEHYTCMVDLFSRAGHFDKALMVIEKVGDDVTLWSALLSGCSKWINTELAIAAFGQLKSWTETMLLHISV